MKNSLYLIIIASVLSFASCDREPMTPPEPVIEHITIAELRDIYESGISHIDSNIYIQGVITLTPELGNVPGMIAYIQDSTAAICLAIDGDNTMAMNSEVKIYCDDVIFENYGGLLQFGDSGSLSIALNMEVISLNSSIDPDTLTITELLTGEYQGRYVCIPNAQFDAPGTYSGSQLLTDCHSEIDVFTRSGATFATETKPTGNGYLKGIYSVYNNGHQILLREPSELDMTGVRCEPVVYLSQNFNTIADNADVNTLTGWLTYPQAGTRTWYGNYVSSSNRWVQATAFESGEESVITWMITPALDLTTAVSPYIRFESANGWDKGASIELFVSSDYDESATPWTSTWTELAFTLPPLSSSGYGPFVSSGNVDLSAYAGDTVYIAWVYTGSSTQTTTWEVDNVLVAED